MAEAILESLDGLDPALAAEYKLVEDEKSPINGRYFLTVGNVDGYELTNPTPLKTALSRERSAATDLQQRITAFGDLDPAAALDALEKVKTFESFDPEKEADKIAQEKFQNLEKQLTTQHSKKIETLEGTLGKTKSALNKALIETAARIEIEKAGGAVEMLLPAVLKHARLKENGDDFIVEIIDEKGFVRIGNDGAEHMDMAGLISEMKESKAFGRGFDAPEESGTGTPPGQSSQRKAKPGGTTPNSYDLEAPRGERLAFLKQKRKSRGR